MQRVFSFRGVLAYLFAGAYFPTISQNSGETDQELAIRQLSMKKLSELSGIFSFLPLLVDGALLLSCYYSGKGYREERTLLLFPDFAVAAALGIRILIQGPSNRHNREEAGVIYRKRLPLANDSCYFNSSCGFLPSPQANEDIEEGQDLPLLSDPVFFLFNRRYVLTEISNFAFLVIASV